MDTLPKNSAVFDDMGVVCSPRKAREHLAKIESGKIRLTREQKSFLRMYRNGVNFTGRHALEALGSDNFVAITLDKAHNDLMAGYGAVPADWQAIVKRGVNRDFKPQNTSALAGQASLPKVKEKQSYTEVNVTDELRNTLTLEKYGVISSFSIEASLNDEMGALSEVNQDLGKAWVHTLNAAAFGALVSTANIYDAAALFGTGAGRLNSLATGANALNAANIKAALALGLAQTGLGGEQLYLDFNTLIVGPKLKFDAMELLASQTYMSATLPTSSTEPGASGATINAGRVGSQNLIRQQVTNLIVSPIITGTKWYLSCDPNQRPWLKMNFLNGQDAPEFVMEPINTGSMFERDASRTKVRGAMGFVVVDYRPVVRGSDT